MIPSLYVRINKLPVLPSRVTFNTHMPTHMPPTGVAPMLRGFLTTLGAGWLMEGLEEVVRQQRLLPLAAESGPPPYTAAAAAAGAAAAPGAGAGDNGDVAATRMMSYIQAACEGWPPCSGMW